MDSRKQKPAVLHRQFYRPFGDVDRRLVPASSIKSSVHSVANWNLLKVQKAERPKYIGADNVPKKACEKQPPPMPFQRKPSTEKKNALSRLNIEMYGCVQSP